MTWRRYALFGVLAACAPRPPNEPALEPAVVHAAPATREPTPSRPTASARYHMRRNFDDLRLIERRLIAGKLADGATLAVLLMRQEDDPAMAPYEVHANRVTRAADALAHAANLDEALRRVAVVAAECAGCHASAGAHFQLPPPATLPAQPAMARHAWAADRMWEGVIAGDTDRWRRGLAVLADSPFGTPPSPLQDLARRELATYSTDLDLRAVAYGKILKACASCHVRLAVERP